MANNRELSQFASYVEVYSGNSVGIATTSRPYIGIGTDDPQAKLHIVGNVLASDIITAREFRGTLTGGTGSIGIQSGGNPIGVVTTLNFIGAGNTFKYNASTNSIDISIQSGSSGISISGFGAVGNGIADDTNALQNALSYVSSRGGGFVYLESGKTYRISSKISVGSSCGIIGDGTPKIYATAAGFNNTDITATGRYLSNSVVIDLSGQTSSPFTTSYNQVLRGFKIESEYQTGRCVSPIVARNCKNLTIENLELYNFPVGVGIRLATITGNSRIINNHIHDFYDDQIYLPLRPQITGIEVDNDRVNGFASENIDISSNVIENITLSAASIAAHGFETDGINIAGVYYSSAVGGAPAGSVCKNLSITNNKVKNVGEGLDTFGHNSIISDNSFYNTYNFGIKMIHGASYNVVKGNTIFNTGIAGVVLAQSSITSGGGVGDIQQNIIDSNIITNVDYLGAWSSSTSTGCIKLDANNTPIVYVPKNNLISNNILRPGQGKYNIVVQRYAVDTSLINNKFVGIGSLGAVFDERYDTSWPNGTRDTSIVNIGGGTSTSNASYIKTGGNLGIGSTAPISELDLRGNYTLNGTTIKNFGVVVHQRPPSGRFVFGQNSVRVSVAQSTFQVTSRTGIVTVFVGNAELPPLTIN